MRSDSKSTTFNLFAVDWDSVGRMRGAHLDVDRVYLEEMLRCALHSGRRGGVVDLRQSSLLPGGATPYTEARTLSINLERCSAITPLGYLIYWNRDQHPGADLSCSLDSGSPENMIPLYLCLEEGREVALSHRPQQITDPCRFVHARLRLATRTGLGELDAIKIAQFKRAPGSSQLSLDSDYIPECLRLNSHWQLERRVGDIKLKARTCLENLTKQLQKGQFGLATMAAPLAAASVLVDGTASPYTYLERMLTVLHTLVPLHFLIQDEGHKRTIESSIQAALSSIEPNLENGLLDWAVTLTQIEKVFEILGDALNVTASTPNATGSGWSFLPDRPIRGGQ